MRRSLILLLLLIGCSADPMPIRIATNLWPGYEPLYLARHTSRISDREIHLVEAGSASQVLRFYRNSLIDGAALTLDEFLVLRNYGYDPVIVLVMDISNGSDVLFVSHEIKSLADLRNRRIGYENTALGAFFLSRILIAGGLKKEEVRLVPVEVMEHADAFRLGRVDGVVTFANNLPAIERLGHVLFDSSQIPGEIIDVLVMERRILNKRPEAVKRLTRSWFRTLQSEKDTRDGREFMASRLQVTEEQLESQFHGLIFPDAAMNHAYLGRDGRMNHAIAAIVPILFENGMIDSEISGDGIFTDAYLPERDDAL